MFELKLIVLTMMLWSSNIVEHGAAGDPQTRMANSGCSTYNASNVQSFHANINATFSELRGDIKNHSKHFGTAQQAIGDVLTYAMFQCRNYLSKNDCLSCFDTASTQIRNCSAANGARVIYDGCFLRYISYKFQEQPICIKKFSASLTSFHKNLHVICYIHSSHVQHHR
ncbi:hypothetical protein VNO80_29820 [Phaseolus coccineus]|uniref:Gnk2-homologous domain-containing protein n=1 Tax=Phaseolus coccineus TaxID=3886 RepID=A0AAN9LBP8_PHACN